LVCSAVTFAVNSSAPSASPGLMSVPDHSSARRTETLESVSAPDRK
jgi:hypothetical protein